MIIKMDVKGSLMMQNKWDFKASNKNTRIFMSELNNIVLMLKKISKQFNQEFKYFAKDTKRFQKI